MYQNNYAELNKNCEIACIALGQKAMSGGMEAIYSATLLTVV